MKRIPGAWVACALIASPVAAQDGTIQAIEGIAQDGWKSIKSWALGTETEAGSDGDRFLEEKERLARHAAAIAEIRGRVDRVIELREERDDAPRSTLNPLARTRQDIQEEIDGVLAEVQSMLFTGAIEDALGEIERLRAEMAELEDEIAELREERWAAPEESAWSRTKADVDEEIARARERIAIAERRADLVRAKVAARFEAIGVELSGEQLELLLKRIDGGDVIGMTALIGVIGEMTDVLEALMRENRNSAEFARRYFGVALVLRQVVVLAQDAYLANARETWLPRLNEIELELRRAIEEDRARASDETDQRRRAIFERNRAQNDKALEVLELYRARLLRQRERIDEARTEAARDVEAAYSTYRTVSLSALLLDLIREQGDSLDALLRIQIPELAPFADPELDRRFEELTEELREGIS